MSVQTLLVKVVANTGSIAGFMKMIFSGLFGLYVILGMMRFYELFSLRRLMREMRIEVQKLNTAVSRLD